MKFVACDQSHEAAYLRFAGKVGGATLGMPFNYYGSCERIVVRRYILIDDAAEIDEAWIAGVETVGVTSGASAPEKLVTGVCDWFRARGVERIEPYRMMDEDVTFRLPVELRRELALAEAQD